IGGGVAFRQAAFVGGPHVVGGFHPGFHPGFRRRAFIAGAVVGAAYAAPYGYYDDSYAYYGYPQGYYDQGYYDQGYYNNGYVEGGCAIVRQPVQTPYGWQYRNVQICQ